MFKALISMGIVLTILTQTLACIPTAVAVTALAVHKKRTKGTIKEPSSVENITVGKTTEAEVKKLWGKPYKKISDKDTKKLVYRFKKTKSKTDADSDESEAKGKYLIITFDKNDVVSHLERTDSP